MEAMPLLLAEILPLLEAIPRIMEVTLLLMEAIPPPMEAILPALEATLPVLERIRQRSEVLPLALLKTPPMEQTRPLMVQLFLDQDPLPRLQL